MPYKKSNTKLSYMAGDKIGQEGTEKGGFLFPTVKKSLQLRRTKSYKVIYKM
jgi:hypothetical protein